MNYILCLISLISTIASQTVPTMGLFYISAYDTNQCTTKLSSSKFYSGNTCWESTSVSGSMKLLSWEPSSKTLAVAYYTDSSGCQNEPVNASLICDGTCNPTGTFGEYSTCIYVDMLPPDFRANGYTDDRCTNVIPLTSSIYQVYVNLCMTTSESTSLIPIDFNFTTKTMTVFTWSNSTTCSGSNANNGAFFTSITCNNECFSNPSLKSNYLKCTLSSSYLAVTWIGVLFWIMLFFV